MPGLALRYDNEKLTFYSTGTDRGVFLGGEDLRRLANPRFTTLIDVLLPGIYRTTSKIAERFSTAEQNYISAWSSTPKETISMIIALRCAQWEIVREPDLGITMKAARTVGPVDEACIPHGRFVHSVLPDDASWTAMFKSVEGAWEEISKNPSMSHRDVPDVNIIQTASAMVEAAAYATRDLQTLRWSHYVNHPDKEFTPPFQGHSWVELATIVQPHWATLKALVALPLDPEPAQGDWSEDMMVGSSESMVDPFMFEEEPLAGQYATFYLSTLVNQLAVICKLGDIQQCFHPAELIDLDLVKPALTAMGAADLGSQEALITSVAVLHQMVISSSIAPAKLTKDHSVFGPTYSTRVENAVVPMSKATRL